MTHMGSRTARLIVEERKYTVDEGLRIAMEAQRAAGRAAERIGR